MVSQNVVCIPKAFTNARLTGFSDVAKIDCIPCVSRRIWHSSFQEREFDEKRIFFEKRIR